MDRRTFLAGAAASAIPGPRAAPGQSQRERGTRTVDARRLPRWRGFNLLEKFTAEQNRPFLEWDFATMAEWGFDFVRLPLSYRCWTDPADWRKMDERVLREIDQAVEFGRKHRVHVNINFHRAPGYCVNPPPEPFSLWKDEEALTACCHHWGRFARRYKGIPSSQLSFDLLNEPALIPEADYVRVATRLVEAIRREDPGRLVVADGLRWGRDPVSGLAGLGIAQSTRGYDPMEISHWRAGWISGSDRWPEPTWPLRKQGQILDREWLRAQLIAPWKDLEKKGVGVHVGEWGAFQHTPHRVVLAWMRDLLELWKEAGWGWALWNFRGSFGVLDSNRKDVAYADFQGHKLDREMLDLIRSH